MSDNILYPSVESCHEAAQARRDLLDATKPDYDFKADYWVWCTQMPQGYRMHKCIRCDVELVADGNWPISCQKQKQYKCHTCYKEQIRSYAPHLIRQECM